MNRVCRHILIWHGLLVAGSDILRMLKPQNILDDFPAAPTRRRIGFVSGMLLSGSPLEYWLDLLSLGQGLIGVQHYWDGENLLWIPTRHVYLLNRGKGQALSNDRVE